MSSIGLGSQTLLRKEVGFGREVNRRQNTWTGQMLVTSLTMEEKETAEWRHGSTMLEESGMINPATLIMVEAMVPSMPCVKLKNNLYKQSVCMHSNYVIYIKGCNSTLITCKLLSCPLYLSLFISSVQLNNVTSSISFTGSDWCFWIRVPRRVFWCWILLLQGFWNTPWLGHSTRGINEAAFIYIDIIIII